MPYQSAKTMEEAFSALQAPDVSVIAGGTDWFPQAGEVLTRKALLDVTGLPGFRGISRDGAGWRIGAATRWSDVLAADLPPAFDGLKAAAREVGSVQIQNRGTIAGNLCNASPAADGVPPLLTLGARVELVSASGSRVLPLEDFITGVRRTALAPGELVSAILIPEVAGRGGFRKLGARRYLVISIAMVAGVIRVERGVIAQAALAVGACSPVARRLPGLEARLLGHPGGAPVEVTPEDLSGLAPITDLRGSGGYRSEAVAELLQRLIMDLTGRPLNG
jgi:CO/xanthine dehydrogenase FAD-binding subunit